MKAWLLSLIDDEDQGEAVVFADTVTEAKSEIYQTNLDENGWTSIRARRYPALDGMEDASEPERSLIQWRNGWRWFDYGTPDPGEAADDEFIKWHEELNGGSL